MDDNGRDITASSPASSPAPSGSAWSFRGLIAGALVGALVLGAVYYLHFAGGEASSERTPPPTSTAEAPASQPSVPDQRTPAPNAPVEQAKAAPAPSAPSPNEQATSSVTPAPGLPTDGLAKPQDRPNLDDRATKPDAAPAPALRDQAASLPAAEVVFVQRPRVKIRSAPNAHAKIVGSAAKGQQFTVTRRAGRWVQVDTGNGRGWISASLLGSQSP